MDITEALELFVQRERGNGRSEHWVQQVTRAVNALALWVPPPRTIDRLDPELLARYLGSAEARFKADGTPRLVTTINATRTALSSFGRFLQDSDLTANNPARLVRRARSSDPTPRALSEVELRRFLDTIAAAKGRAARRDLVLFSILSSCGLRVSSALALEARDIDFGAGEVVVRNAKAGQRYRAILPSSLHEMLRAHIAEVCGGRLFEIGRRQAHARMQYWLGVARIEMRVGVHALRAGLAMKVLKAGDIYLAQHALGHRSISSTARYLVPDREKLRALMDS